MSKPATRSSQRGLAVRPANLCWALIKSGMLAVLLVACGTTVPPGVEPIDYTAAPRDLVPVASYADSHPVRFIGRGYVGKLERNRLDEFVAAVAHNRPESLRVALHGHAAPAQYKTVADMLVADGVDPMKIARAERWSEPLAPRGTVIVAIERAVAVLPNCPGWISHVSAPVDNLDEPNFGCSDVSNFAAMVADPHHLAEGASSIYQDGERAASAVAEYRSDKIYDKWIREVPKSETFNVISSTGR